MSLDGYKIFSLFDSGSAEQDEKQIKNMDEHPLMIAAMFIRVMKRGKELSDSVIDFLTEIGFNLPTETSREVHRSLIHQRGYYYLTQLNLEDPHHREVLLEKMGTGANFVEACDALIEFFVDREEYEKCSKIQEYKNLIEKSQKKLPS